VLEMKLRPVCGFLLAGLSFSTLSMAEPPSYSVRELGANQVVIGINNRGEVLTWEANDSAPTYLYEKNGEAINLSALPLLLSECKYSPAAGPLYVAAAGLNNRGFVLMNVYGAQANPDPGPDCIVLYHEGSLFRDRRLGPNAYAVGINDRNQIIGNRGEPDNQYVGVGPRCDFKQSGSVITAVAINDRGQIAGVSANGWNGAELCTDGVWQVIPGFPGALAPAVAPMFASAINNKGEVVGTAAVAVGPSNIASRGFLYSNGQTVDLGVLAALVPGQAPDNNVYPESINEKSQIVGAAYTQAGPTVFLYQDGQIYDVMTLISVDDPLNGLVQLLGGSQINDEGVIAANGLDLRTGAVHVYVLTPRPATLAAQARRGTF
jgi:probable HAF family extracellular repeat protein